MAFPHGVAVVVCGGIQLFSKKIPGLKPKKKGGIVKAKKMMGGGKAMAKKKMMGGGKAMPKKKMMYGGMAKKKK